MIFFIKNLSNSDTDVILLDATFDYECLKSYCKIATSSKIFIANNEEWSNEWQDLIKKIKK